jgi:hypothetical protein
MAVPLGGRTQGRAPPPVAGRDHVMVTTAPRPTRGLLLVGKRHAQERCCTGEPAAPKEKQPAVPDGAEPGTTLTPTAASRCSKSCVPLMQHSALGDGPPPFIVAFYPWKASPRSRWYGRRSVFARVVLAAGPNASWGGHSTIPRQM